MSCTFKKYENTDEISNILYQYFANEYEEGYVLAGEDETFLVSYFQNYYESMKSFEVRDSDVFVCSFPKTGSTWTQEMVWLISNNLDYEVAKTRLLQRFAFFEACGNADWEKLNRVLSYPDYLCNSIEYTKNLPSPRFIKTHLPFNLLPDQIQNGTKRPKMIYVVRNPKDACVSFYHHGKLLRYWRPSLEDFCKVFLADKILYAPFWKHVFGFWERRDSPNLLITSYEEMKQDLPGVVKRVAAFLGKTLTDEQIQHLCEHLSFDSMRANKAVNAEDTIKVRKEKKLTLEDGSFIRSGTVGKHKEELAPEIIEQFDAWIKKNVSGTSFEQHYNYVDENIVDF